MKAVLILSLACFGCSGRAPIDRAAMLNKSLAGKASSLDRFSKYSGVEEEQSQIKQASSEFTRDIGLVRGCLKDRGGIANPICRADASEVENRVEWIVAASDRGIADVDKSSANEKTRKAARRSFVAIQASAQKIQPTLNHGGLLVRRHSTAHAPQLMPPLGLDKKGDN